MGDFQPMMSSCLDLVVQPVTLGVKRFAEHTRRQRLAVGSDADIEAAKNDVPGLEPVDQLVEPIEQERSVESAASTISMLSSRLI